MSYIDMNQSWIYMYIPSQSPLPPPSLPNPSESSQCTRPEHLSHASNRDCWCFTIDNIHVSMLTFLFTFSSNLSQPSTVTDLILFLKGGYCVHHRFLARFFFSFIFISWRLITLQYCSGFCHTLTWSERIALKQVYYLGWNRSPAQVGCMRQVLRAGALGRPRGMGWRGRWEGGSGWGTQVFSKNF